VIGYALLASVAPILSFCGLSGCRGSARRVSNCTNPVSGLEISPDVRIWYVPHGPGNDHAHHCATFAVDDIREFAAIRDTAKRRRSLTTRAVLRAALSETVGGTIAPDAWRFGRTEMDKPVVLNGPKNLNFSCSHTEWASIVAVSASREVGIDIEASIIPSTGQWLADTFTASERAAINTLPVSDRDQAISRLWTLKEAYLKMLGTGIADASLVAFDPSNDRLVSAHQGRRGGQPTFQTWVAKCQGHRLSAAIAMSRPKTGGALWRQPIEEALVHLRTRLAFPHKRADKRTAPASPLFRIPGGTPA
jgi:4'-phosphopantetheinyl transferase